MHFCLYHESADQTCKVEDMYHLIDDGHGDDDTMSAASPGSVQTADLPFVSPGAEITLQHPPPSTRQKLWTAYKENVDPLIKALHVPTIERQIEDYLSDPGLSGLPRTVSAFLFTMYFAAASSLDPHVCSELLQANRDQLISQFRCGAETALMCAGLLTTSDLLVLQSFVIYIVSLRQFDPRLSWTLCALGFRLMHSIGAHRDGELLNMSVFDSEMYRRIAWLLCNHECATAGDSGCDPTMYVVPAMFPSCAHRKQV